LTQPELPRLTIEIPHLSKTSEIDIDSGGVCTVLLRSILPEELYVPIRLTVKIERRTSIVTFSTLLRISNELSFPVRLQSVLEVPSALDPSHALSGLAATATLLGSAYPVKPGETAAPFLLTTCGAMALSVKQAVTTPILSLFEERHTVFRIPVPMSYHVIELEIVDNSLGFLATLRPAPFPTPIMIANALDDCPLVAYQMNPLQPFHITPESTGIFAFDEPTAYPAVQFWIESTVYRVSLVEDTEPVRLSPDFHDRPVYCEVRTSRNGTKLVVVTHDPPPETRAGHFHSRVTVDISKIAVFVIDNGMREILALDFLHLFFKLAIGSQFVSNKLTVDSVRLFDQHPTADAPLILVGLQSGPFPFITIEALCRVDVPPFSSFELLSITFQPIVINIDRGFAADIAALAASLIPEATARIQPVTESRIFAVSVITYRWLEIPPISLTLNYRGRHSRHPDSIHLPGLVKLIPRTTGANMLLPGVVVAHITDRPDALAAKISADYFAEAFKQAVRLLGAGGRLLSRFGFTTKIASALKISLNTDLSAEVAQFSENLAEGFVNLTETNAGFSRECLEHLARHVLAAELSPTATIGRLIQGTETGLKMKRISGFGHGHGLVGVLTLAPQRMEVDHANQRRRTPRAFPYNVILEYDASIAVAQRMIAGKIDVKDRIRVAVRCAQTDRLLVCTDTVVFLLSPDLRNIKAEYRIAELKKCSSNIGVLQLEFGKGKSLAATFPDTESAAAAQWYLKSQRRTLDYFHASMLK
jgi:hypothetical protein